MMVLVPGCSGTVHAGMLTLVPQVFPMACCSEVVVSNHSSAVMFENQASGFQNKK